MKRVIIESPFAGDVARHLRYLNACIRHSLEMGEAPFASHGFYPLKAGGPLDDNDPDDREHGIQAGFAWRDAADLTAVYDDLGMSKGMDYGVEDAKEKGRPIVYRQLGGEWGAVARWDDRWAAFADKVRTIGHLGLEDPGLVNSFLYRIKARLEQGEKDYAGSAERKSPETIALEQCEELEDDVGWGFWDASNPRRALDALDTYRIWLDRARRAGIM